MRKHTTHPDSITIPKASPQEQQYFHDAIHVYFLNPINPTLTALNKQDYATRLDRIPANAEASLHNSNTTQSLSNIPPASCSIASLLVFPSVQLCLSHASASISSSAHPEFI